MTPLAAYLLLFVAVGTGFIFVHLVAGKLIRPNKPGAEKGTIYECGEPTIGSAWVQFDLRFYVVALLFVIFDVEVAFFFPWAEVFGKANAIANTPDPKTAAQYNDLGTKILDLSYPSDSPVATANQFRWKKMRSLTDTELSAFVMLSPAQRGMLRSMTKEQTDAVLHLTPPQRPVLKTSVGELRATFAAQARERDAALKPLLDAAEKDDRGQVADMIRGSQASDLANMAMTTLADFAAGKAPILTVTRPAVMAPPNPLLTRLEKNSPQALRTLRSLSTRQAEQLRLQARGILDRLRTAGPAQTALWGVLSVQGMEELESIGDEQIAVLPDLSREGIMTLSDPIASRAKEQARSIAWMALGEILVFFGVLLVGFAYLWKRGDLAWVRSTTAAETVDRVEFEQAALAPEAARTLQHAGAGEHAAP